MIKKTTTNTNEDSTKFKYIYNNKVYEFYYVNKLNYKVIDENNYDAFLDLLGKFYKPKYSFTLKEFIGFHKREFSISGNLENFNDEVINLLENLFIAIRYGGFRKKKISTNQIIGGAGNIGKTFYIDVLKETGLLRVRLITQNNFSNYVNFETDLWYGNEFNMLNLGQWGITDFEHLKNISEGTFTQMQGGRQKNTCAYKYDNPLIIWSTNYEGDELIAMKERFGGLGKNTGSAFNVRYDYFDANKKLNVPYYDVIKNKFNRDEQIKVEYILFFLARCLKRFMKYLQLKILINQMNNRELKKILGKENEE